ncbi:hypothetical protein CMV37_23350 [Bacillus cereus]|nr:hypothetical protein CMV37_23350 [Bacillus cereus]
MIIAPLSKRYSVGMDGEYKDEKTNLYVYIQPRCVSVVAFVFLIELSKFAGLIGDTKCFFLK